MWGYNVEQYFRILFLSNGSFFDIKKKFPYIARYVRYYLHCVHVHSS